MALFPGSQEAVDQGAEGQGSTTVRGRGEGHPWLFSGLHVVTAVSPLGSEHHLLCPGDSQTCRHCSIAYGRKALLPPQLPSSSAPPTFSAPALPSPGCSEVRWFSPAAHSPCFAFCTPVQHHLRLIKETNQFHASHQHSRLPHRQGHQQVRALTLGISMNQYAALVEQSLFFCFLPLRKTEAKHHFSDISKCVLQEGGTAFFFFSCKIMRLYGPIVDRNGFYEYFSWD